MDAGPGRGGGGKRRRAPEELKEDRKVEAEPQCREGGGGRGDRWDGFRQFTWLPFFQSSASAQPPD